MDALTAPYERQQWLFSRSSAEIKGGKRKERRKGKKEEQAPKATP